MSNPGGNNILLFSHLIVGMKDSNSSLNQG